MGVNDLLQWNGPPLEGTPVTYRSDTGRVFQGTATKDGLVRIAGYLMIHMLVPELTLAPYGDPVVIVAPLERCEWRRP